MSNAKKLELGRRDLMKIIGGTAIATGLAGPRPARAAPGGRFNQGFPDTLQAPPVINAAPGSEGFWNQVRKAFPLPDTYIHMNTGTTGSQPFFSLNNLAVYNLWKSEDPRDWAANLTAAFPTLMKSVTERQNAIAAMFDASPGEIVLSYNTTDACNLFMAGTPWKPGDRIITTTFEHPALAGPLAWVRDYMGVNLVIISLPSNWTVSVAELLSWFENELKKPLPSGAKQYVATCEIFYKNGIRMPVKPLCALARSYGAYTFIDNAHGWGMIPVKCHDYGADFIAGAGHKWLCGGPGTGIFYVRNSGSNLPPWNGGNWGGYGNLFVAPSATRYNNRTWAPNGIQGRGETNTPALYAMSDSASFFAQVGLQAVYNRGVALAQYLQQKIANRWGPSSMALQNFTEPEYRTFLTAVNPFKDKDSNDPAKYAAMNTAINAILAALAGGTPKIYVRSITWHDTFYPSAGDNRVAFRIGTHAMYNNRDQIDFFFQRLVEEVDKSGLPQLP